MSKEDFIKYAAYFSLILTVSKALWPEFTAIVRMIWSDVIVALAVTSTFQSTLLMVVITIINIILLLFKIAHS
jgi:hypothetical protein